MADPTPVVPAAAPVSGWKSTEMWLAMLLLGGAVGLEQQVVTSLPAILASLSMPGWAAPLLALVPVALSFVLAKTTNAYTQARLDLKLAHLDAISSAGDAAAAAVQTPAQADAALGVVVTPVKQP